jgi:hypothetical protein
VIDGGEMATVASTEDWRRNGNPFPPSAVAHISDLRPEALTIKTKAVEQIDTVLDGYLRAPRSAGSGRSGSVAELADTGRVCVIEGDYGTGKTHLAIEILDRVEAARASERMDIQDFYAVAPGGTFLTLYVDLMSRIIGRHEVLARVREIYADIVADALRDWPLADTLVQQLQRGVADPLLVIDRYGLQEGALQEELRQRLRLVTSDETFGRGLMLLLEPDLRDLAWGWLTGKAPDQVLMEWGVETAIATDVTAMEALGVIARLYGRGNRRLVLVLDEMERLALRWDRSDAATAQAFKTLLEVFRGAGAFLVICGLPDMRAVLPKETGRIDAVVHPSLLEEDNVRWYVEQTLRRFRGNRTLEPFTKESIGYLVYLTGGIAREVIRLCYEAYEEALESGHEITVGLVSKVARRGSPGGGAQRVRVEIGEILLQEGWPAERHQVLGDPPGVPVDFWIPVGGKGAGCAVVVTDSVLEKRQAAQLAAQLRAIRSSAQGRAVLLVVVGYLPGDLRQSLADAVLGGALLVYLPRSFEKDFPGLVRAITDRAGPARVRVAEALVPVDQVVALRTETERMARQQSYALRLLQELIGRTEELSGSLGRVREVPGRLIQLERAVEELSSPADSPPREVRRPDLPAELEALFGNAQRALDAYGDLRAFVDNTFAAAAREHGARLSVIHRLRDPEAFNPIGIAAFLSDLLHGFRESVRAWLTQFGETAEPGGEPSTAERDQLEGVCRAYDALYGVTPVFRFDPLPDVSNTAPGEQELLAQAAWSVRREALRDAFDGLGEQVRQAALRAASSG